MLNAFWWLLTVEAIGIAAFPIAYALLPRLRDRGYSVTKPLGILILGYLAWILSVLHVVPSVRLSIALLLLAMGAASAWYAWHHREELKAFVRREWRTIVIVEAVFLAFFIGWAIFQAYDPAINHTEQPMDFAFLNGSIESTVGSPRDPWLSGASISYYYFGHWMMGVVSELTGIGSNITYNLALALIPALAAAAVFGLVLNLVRSEGSKLGYAIVAGLAAAFLVGLSANLEGVLEFMRANGMGTQDFWDWVRVDGLDGTQAPGESWMPEEFWWWFRATRVINTFDGGQSIDYTIQEFPFFSYVLGDLHAHVMSVPFVLLFVAFCWNYVRSTGGLRKDSVSLVAMGLSLGGLAFANIWDMPVFAALFLGATFLRAYRSAGGEAWKLAAEAGLSAVVVIGLAFLLYVPYYASFSTSASGVASVVGATTRPIHLLIVWAVFLVAVVPFICVSFLRTTVGPDWRRLAVLGLGAGFLPYVAWALLHLLTGGASDPLPGRFFHHLPLGLLISAAVYTLVWLARHEGVSGRVFALTLAALGLLLIAGSELLFIRDFFNTRVNTLFKLYYQSWVLLAVASGFSLYYWSTLRASLTGWKRSLTTFWGTVFVVLLIASLYYPAAAVPSKGTEAAGGATLDGLAFVRESRPAEYEAIQFLRANADTDSTMVEAVGEWGDAGLMSRSTGVPTVLNWPGHEHTWRGSTKEFEHREADIATIYSTESVEEAKVLLDRYNVDYVYVGLRETEKYGTQGLAKFSGFTETVFSRGDVRIYRIVR